MPARALIRRETRKTSAPSVTRGVICVSSAFLLDGPRKKRDCSQSTPWFFHGICKYTVSKLSFILDLTTKEAFTVLCSVVKHAGGGQIKKVLGWGVRVVVHKTVLTICHQSSLICFCCPSLFVQANFLSFSPRENIVQQSTALKKLMYQLFVFPMIVPHFP